MRNFFLKVAITVCSLVVFVSVNAEETPFSIAVQGGYASPQGSWFKAVNGEKISKFGVNAEFDALYYLKQFDYKLGIGVTINYSLLLSDRFGDIELYELGLYGIKGQWRFLNSKISPYVAFSFGLTQFTTPKIPMGNGVAVKIEDALNVGIRPETGVEFGAFFLSAGYIIPMTYSIKGGKYSINEINNSAGALQINLGIRISLFDRY